MANEAKACRFLPDYGRLQKTDASALHGPIHVSSAISGSADQLGSRGRGLAGSLEPVAFTGSMSAMTDRSPSSFGFPRRLGRARKALIRIRRSIR
nr:hypothetical protein [Sinirhodobacter hankyongi]